jgi:uncharacterized protein YaaR (DUF327 family)
MQEGVDNTDTLDFYLNKSQISALIALLIESEMVEPLRKKSKVNIAKYNFFTSYFRAIDPETNQKLTLTTLQDDLSKFDKGKRLSSLNAIFKSIELAYERLISGDA